MNLPKHLRPETRTWAEEIIEDYSLDGHHIKILVQAAEAWDRIEEARERIETEGAYYIDRFGAPRRHPAVADERAGRVVFARLLRELSLDAEPPDSRPPRLRY